MKPTKKELGSLIFLAINDWDYNPASAVFADELAGEIIKRFFKK